ncbi:rhomboid-like protein [Wenjunlia tyrosinilytica]|uniref:Membrane protein n=1 Tax=Wenjunlia tyrosinilytica TaxID=1544741 RepID=A0A917ZXF5_9ACTN|nr:rhomboid-like protein [Wenjunlia tyrosinilytica]GGO97493.1 membrane protein [Wenjunlia tyrosinilytica]
MEFNRALAAVRRGVHAVVGWVCAAPGTYIWLFILWANSRALAEMPDHVRDWFLLSNSTNLVGLFHNPVWVLVVSAFWTEKPSFLLWLVAFHVFHVPAERLLGTRRWLAVVVCSHVGATLVSQYLVWVGIRTHTVAHSRAFTIDIGVSYAIAGVAAVLAYRVPARLRWVYLAAVLAYFSVPLVTSHTFTDFGHFSAALIGLACYPLTRGAEAEPAERRSRSAAGSAAG